MPRVRLSFMIAACLGCALAPVRAEVSIGFENLPGVGFSGGTPVVEESQLAQQFSSLGVSFRSAPGYAALVHLGDGHAFGGQVGFAGVNPDGLLDYGIPVEIMFHQPHNTDRPSVVDFVSVRLDLAGGGGPITITAFGLDGASIGEVTIIDEGGAELRIDAPGMHRAVLQGNGSSAFDQLSFGSVLPGRTVVHFEDLPSMTFLAGNSVPDEARLTTQFASAGVVFLSAGGAAAVVNLGQGHARSGALGLGGITSDGRLSYGEEAPLVISFVDPFDPSLPAVTTFAEIWLDRIHSGEGAVTLQAVDTTETVVATSSTLDSADEPFVRVEHPRIHKLIVTGNGSTALDDLWFETVRPLRPILSIRRIEGQAIRVSWPAIPEFVLDFAESLPPDFGWQSWPRFYGIEGGDFVLEFQPSESQKFFRLRRD